MDFFDLKNIAERFMEILNPISEEKIIRIGELLGLKKDDHVIDFGCGYAEPLAIWSSEFEINGVGIDIRPHACDRAKKKLVNLGFRDRIEIICMDASKYEYKHGEFDAATCIGATFIWGGFGKTIRGMKPALKPGSKMAIGEVFWLTDNVPPECYKYFEFARKENELLQEAWDEGFEIEHILRATDQDFDAYESGNWFGLLKWLEENPDHQERDDVLAHLHDSQDEYFRFGHKYLGWAVFILRVKS